MNLRRLDLNLLVIFDALMAERNVTRAAHRIALSQPAFSNALSRLRHHLKDELFIRGPDGMLPTPRALELAPQIHAVLAALEAALDPQHFEPHSAERTFTIDTNDYMVSTAMPVLMARLAELAPGIDVRVLPPAGKAFERLDAREADFALGTYGEIPERFGVAIIDDNDFSCAMREGHALARGRFDLKRYAEARHLLITPRGDPSGFVDEALARHGLTRRIALTVNHFTVVPSIIASTDLITTIPKRIADQYAPLYRLKLRPSPVETPRNYAHIQLLWHKRLGQHAAYNWFRELLFSIVARKRTAGAN
jgi:DNA-binding transcriptional LysR family regulator